ncbi:hypothetical protein SAMN05444406_10452 [Caldicoprobacter faecalis]|uniref:Uncharacterized protein n=1 Tax=Caldicoprobacter faecalis TaxID=937334 RepID=A0A1I5TC01_9FIRM|nr:hypothetical protein SAMN05444406_10452 [Caldicoprobacter faecalis]
MNRICILIMTLAIAAALVVAGMVRASFVDIQNMNLDDLLEYKVSGGGPLYEEDISFSKLVADSEVIVKVVASERKFLQGTSLTGVKVISVYKGDSDLANSTIYVFEPCYFDFEGRLFFAYGGYNFMKYGEEYILFLKKWPYMDYMRYNPFYRNKDIYMLSHNRGIDKYCTAGVLFDKVLSREQEYCYGQIAEYEVIAYSQEELNKYNKIKKQVLEQFLNSINN